MKSLFLILLLAVMTTPACSRFTAGGRQERAYAKYQKKLQKPRESRLAKLPRYFTAGGRQERAYAKYRKKLRVSRERRLAKLHRGGSKKPPPEVLTSTELPETTEIPEISESPLSVPDNLNGE